MVQSHSGVSCSLTLDAVPGYLVDLYVYLNIEMAIVLLQWVSFAVMPSRTLSPLIVVTVGSIVRWVLPFRSWSVIGLSSSLLLVFGLYIIYILHFFICIYKSLLILFFSHDLVLVFIAKALFFSSVIFKSYSHLSNSRHKQRVLSQSVDVAR